MKSEAALSVLVAAAVADWGARVVAIPAGYAIGAWIGTTIAFLAGYDRDSRTDLRDLLGICGGAVGCAVWIGGSL
jgi:hypothetical protein